MEKESKMRKTSVILVLVLIIGFGATFALSSQPVGKIMLELSGKKTCAFDHTAHEKVVPSCQKCHHKDASSAEQKCSKCHTIEGTKEVSKAKDAFHKQCIGCHKEMSKGPKSCKECHPKKES